MADLAEILLKAAALPGAPEGSLAINANGTVDVKNYETAVVSVIPALAELSAPAGAAQILSGTEAYGDDAEVILGTMPNNGSAAGVISTREGVVAVPAGYTSGGAVSIAVAEQQKILAANIREGVTILGIAGTHQDGKFGIRKYKSKVQIYSGLVEYTQVGNKVTIGD